MSLARLSDRRHRPPGASFVVETGVPIPQSRYGYPWDAMAVGQSFFVPCNGDERRQLQCRISACGRGWARRRLRTGYRFSVRQVEGGLRVWRTS